MEIIVFEKESYYKMLGEFANLVKEIAKENKEENLWADREEAMKILGCKKSKLQNLRDKGEIEFSQNDNGRIIKYFKPSLAAYLKKHLIGNTYPKAKRK